MGPAALQFGPGGLVGLLVRITDACLDRQGFKGKKSEIRVADIYFLISIPYFEIKMFDDHVAGFGRVGQPCFDGNRIKLRQKFAIKDSLAA